MEQDVSPNPEEAGTRDGWGRPVAWALAVVLMAVAIAKSRPEEEGAEVAPRTPESPPVVSVAPPPALDSGEDVHLLPTVSA
ncbi:MAG: hypothetical protein KDA80_05820, partial [Planctomycetaceae bacterium]|nr:hypothetical protein [Planctomycetaceae bacterium]